jgi:hypothetical protein
MPEIPIHLLPAEQRARRYRELANKVDAQARSVEANPKWDEIRKKYEQIAMHWRALADTVDRAVALQNDADVIAPMEPVDRKSN